MVAVGVFLATLLWLGWDGGAVGEKIADWLRGAFGAASYVIPLVLLVLGTLMLVRSKLVDLKPFRTGLVIGAFGLMLALGRDEGGAIGSGLAGGLANVVGETGVLIVGIALFVAGTLLFTGGSVGAVLRTSGGAMRRAGGAARRSFDGFEMPDFGGSDDLDDDFEAERHQQLVDAATSYPDVIEPVATSAESPQLVMHSEEDAPDAVTAGDAYEELEFDSAVNGAEYRLPDRSILKPSPAVKGDNGVQSAKTAEQLVQTLSHFGVDATIVGQIAGPQSRAL